MNSTSGMRLTDQLSVLAHGLRQDAAPQVQLLFILCQDLADQGLEGLCQCRVWDVALELVELTRCEKRSSFTTADLPTPE